MISFVLARAMYYEQRNCNYVASCITIAIIAIVMVAGYYLYTRVNSTQSRVFTVYPN